MRSPVYQRVTAVGKSALVPLSYLQGVFNVGIGIIPSQDNTATGAATVQFTYDDFGPDSASLVGVSQTTTVITVTDPSLPLRGGVAVGDIVQLRNTGFANIDGVYTVTTAPSTTTYTVTSGTSQSAVGGPNSAHQYWRLFNSVIASATSLRAFGNLSLGTAAAAAALSGMNSGPATGVLLNVTTLPAGSYTMVVVQGSGSLG